MLSRRFFVGKCSVECNELLLRTAQIAGRRGGGRRGLERAERQAAEHSG
jgi:hypothetical protein